MPRSFVTRHYHDALTLQNNRCTSVVVVVVVVVNVHVVSIIAIITHTEMIRTEVARAVLSLGLVLVHLPPPLSPTIELRDLPIRLTFVYFRWRCSCTRWLPTMMSSFRRGIPTYISTTLFPFSWDRTRCSGLFMRYCMVNSGDFYRHKRAPLVPLVDS